MSISDVSLELAAFCIESSVTVVEGSILQIGLESEYCADPSNAGPGL
jgi:hypothetical protein